MTKSTRAKKGKARKVSQPTTSGQPPLSISKTDDSLNIPAHAVVAHLKEKIKATKEDDLEPYEADTLALFKLKQYKLIKPDITLGHRVDEQIGTGGFESFATDLSSTDTVSEIFEVQPNPKRLHIYVKLPADDFRPAKRICVDNQETEGPALMTWSQLHEKVSSNLSTPIPLQFRVAKGNSNCATGTLEPINFDLHIPLDRQLRFVKWAPRLVEYGMENLKTLHPKDATACDPGHHFWRGASSIRAMYELVSTPFVTGEAQIRSRTVGYILSPICSIASRIIFHLNSDPPTLEQGDKHYDLYAQVTDNGPPLWATVIKLSDHENSPSSKQIMSILIERIIYALGFKSFTAAPSTFFYHLGCRAAANIFRDPKAFLYQTCVRGTDCRHNKPRSFQDSVYVPEFFDKLDEVPNFDPSQEEAEKLLADICMLNDDSADKSGTLTPNDTVTKLGEHPRVHVALAIMRTGAVSLSQDTHDDPIAEKQASAPRRASEHIRDSAPRVGDVEGTQEVDCSYTDLPDDKHEELVLQQLWAEMVHRDLTFSALTTSKDALFVYRSRSDQTLYVSTPFLPGATKPSFMQALLGQIISAYREALERNTWKETTPGRRGNGREGGGNGGRGTGGNGSRTGSGNGSHGGGSKSRSCPRGNDSCECGYAHKDDHHEGDHGGCRGCSEGGIYNVVHSKMPGSDERKEKARQEIPLEIPVATRSANEQLALSKLIIVGDTYMCIHDGFYDSARSALLRPLNYLPSHRHSVSEQSIPPLVSSSSNTSMESTGLSSTTEDPPSMLCLTQRLGNGAVGKAWRGVFSSSLEPGIVLDIVAKVGRFEDAQPMLIHEARIYKQLQKYNIDGVPVLIGLFDDVDDQAPILVTTYAGEKIRDAKDSLKAQFHQILGNLHKVGICHGDLQKENMCCLNGKAMIIDFDQAFQTHRDVDFESERLQLAGLLSHY